MTDARQAAADHLATRAEAIADRAVREMYGDPFWLDRFGQRGRTFAEEDGRFHLTYLIEALRTTNPESLVTYATWLRSVLTSRGMCTRHLAENFHRLRAAIGAEGIPLADVASEYLERAEAALSYDAGDARAIQEATPAIAAGVGDSLGTAHASPDATVLLSYVADAIAFERLDLLAAHVRWSEGFFDRIGRGHGYLRARLDAMTIQAARIGADGARRRYCEVLEVAALAISGVRA